MIATLLLAAADAASDQALAWALVGVGLVVIAALFVAWGQWVGRDRED
jgi:hypothetical protein